MHFSTSSLVAVILGAAAVSAETFNVLVGKDGGLTYEPPFVTAKVGDVIAFQFLSKNHTVTQSTFASPCVPKAEGVDSGYQFVPGGAAQIPAWSITINNDTAPLWFFCNQGAHCKNGMVFAVNPSAERTYEAFAVSAAAGGGATTGPNAAGGAPPAPGAPAPPSSGTTPQTASGASPSASVTLQPAPPATPPAAPPAGPGAAGAANAGSVPSGNNPGTDSSANQIDLPGGALTSRSMRTGWMLAGVMGAVALLL